MSDIDTLKAWCRWKREQVGGVRELIGKEGETELVQAVEDVISQVGTWKAKYEKARSDMGLAVSNAGKDLIAERDQLRAENEKLKADLSDHHVVYEEMLEHQKRSEKAEAELAEAIGCLEFIAKVTYGAENSMDDTEWRNYWSALACRYQRNASECLKRLKGGRT